MDKFVAFYPAPDDPGANLSKAVLAKLVKVHEDGTADVEVEGVILERVDCTPADVPFAPHTWTP